MITFFFLLIPMFPSRSNSVERKEKCGRNHQLSSAKRQNVQRHVLDKRLYSYSRKRRLSLSVLPFWNTLMVHQPRDVYEVRVCAVCMTSNLCLPCVCVCERECMFFWWVASCWSPLSAVIRSNLGFLQYCRYVCSTLEDRRRYTDWLFRRSFFVLGQKVHQYPIN